MALTNLTFISLLLLVVFVYLFVKQKLKYDKLYDRFRNVADIDSEISKQNRKLEEIRTKINETDADYKNRRAAYEKTLKDFRDLTDIQSGITKGNQKLNEIQAKISDLVLDYKTNELYITNY